MVSTGGGGEASQQMAPCDRDSRLLWGQEGGDQQQGVLPEPLTPGSRVHCFVRLLLHVFSACQVPAR